MHESQAVVCVTCRCWGRCALCHTVYSQASSRRGHPCVLTRQNSPLSDLKTSIFCAQLSCLPSTRVNPHISDSPHVCLARPSRPTRTALPVCRSTWCFSRSPNHKNGVSDDRLFTPHPVFKIRSFELRIVALTSRSLSRENPAPSGRLPPRASNPTLEVPCKSRTPHPLALPVQPCCEKTLIWCCPFVDRSHHAQTNLGRDPKLITGTRPLNSHHREALDRRLPI